MRHIEKLKKIFTCCGKECSADTNGAALDELLTLAEAGEISGGNVQELKEVEVNGGNIEVLPDDGFNSMAKVKIKVNVNESEKTSLYCYKKYGDPRKRLYFYDKILNDCAIGDSVTGFYIDAYDDLKVKVNGYYQTIESFNGEDYDVKMTNGDMYIRCDEYDLIFDY